MTAISGMPSESLPLFPTPRHLEFLPGACATDAPVQEQLDSTITGDEAYRICIRNQGIVLSAGSAVGLRWARTTLRQIRALRPQVLPCLVIDDAPAFAQRGFMLDLSRDRVPTLATLMALVETIAALKGNHLQLYVEHALAYTGHDAVWSQASPLTLDELAALDRFASSHGVSLNANQNCLGHFDRWLKHPRYAPLGELAVAHLHNGAWLTEPCTLCPEDPRTLALLADLLHQQLGRCSGPYANIGCDEPWDLGLGRSKAACDRDGRQRVFSRHVAAVAALATGLGKRPMFWCDPHPNEDDGLPPELVALVWGYEYDEDFATRCQAHRDQGREVWVCPGTATWRSTTGRTSYRRKNLARAAHQGLSAGAHGMLVTEWGDLGHRQPWPTTLFGLAEGMQAAWTGGDRFDAAAAGRAVFGSAELGDWLAELGEVDGVLTQETRNHSACFFEGDLPMFDPHRFGSCKQWADISAAFSDLAMRLPSSPFAAECRLGLDQAQWAADRAVARRGQISDGQRREFAQRMCDLLARYRSQWLSRCGYGGLEDSCARLRIHARHVVSALPGPGAMALS